MLPSGQLHAEPASLRKRLKLQSLAITHRSTRNLSLKVMDGFYSSRRHQCNERVLTLAVDICPQNAFFAQFDYIWRAPVIRQASGNERRR